MLLIAKAKATDSYGTAQSIFTLKMRKHEYLILLSFRLSVTKRLDTFAREANDDIYYSSFFKDETV